MTDIITENGVRSFNTFGWKSGVKVLRGLCIPASDSKILKSTISLASKQFCSPPVALWALKAVIHSKKSTCG